MSDAFEDGDTFNQPQSLKEQKEAFVTGHAGTTATECLLVCLAAPVGVFAYLQIMRAIMAVSPPSHFLRTNTLVHVTKVLIEVMVILLPMTVNQTLFLDPWGLYLMLGLFLLGLCLLLLAPRQTLLEQSSHEQRVSAKNNLVFLSFYRSSVMYLTFVAILAVDFNVFPRRFAKTETEGCGLMDLGAGSFVIAAGLVSKRAKAIISFSGPHDSERRRSRKLWFHTVPILLLGFIRLATTKGLEYQEHVTEYGVHWNFFFTLAVVNPFARVLPMGWRIPTSLMLTYQLILSRHELQEYIEDGPRRCEEDTPLVFRAVCGLFAANREGILGCIGYLSLFLASEFIAHRYIWLPSRSKIDLPMGKILCTVGLSLVGMLQVLSHFLHIPVSRRSTNISFCVWTLAHNVLLLGLLCLATNSADCSMIGVSPIFNSVNRYGLLVFVVANLLTGAVNLSFNTLEATNGDSILILLCYLCSVGGFALIVDSILPAITNMLSPRSAVVNDFLQEEADKTKEKTG